MRDRAVTRELRRRGWKVLRVWEHALVVPEMVINRCRRALVTTLAKKETGHTSVEG